MSRISLKNALVLAGVSIGWMAQAQAQPARRPLPIDLAVTYTAERAKIVAGNCNCFWLQGGSADAAVTIFRGLGVAGNITGGRASDIGPGVDLNKISFMAGPRYTWSPTRWSNRSMGTKHETRIFAEGLFGIAHGFDSVFPAGAGFKDSANSFSLQAGGGVDIALVKGFGIRAIELDYVRTQFLNHGSDTQNDFRLAAGISYRLNKRWR